MAAISASAFQEKCIRFWVLRRPVEFTRVTRQTPAGERQHKTSTASGTSAACIELVMTKPKENHKHSLVDPSKLSPQDAKDLQLLQVIIETPKGSRNKYGFDSKQRIFALTKVLPAGMAFPYDFGFVPSTEAEDGDGTDVLVLMDEPAFAGCLLKCRVIGVIEGVQLDGKKKTRNDRIVAIEQANHSYAKVQHINELGKQFVQELETFFVNYHEMIGLKYKILDVRGPKQAWRRIKAGIAALK